MTNLIFKPNKVELVKQDGDCKYWKIKNKNKYIYTQYREDYIYVCLSNSLNIHNSSEDIGIHFDGYKKVVDVFKEMGCTITKGRKHCGPDLIDRMESKWDGTNPRWDGG